MNPAQRLAPRKPPEPLNRGANSRSGSDRQPLRRVLLCWAVFLTILISLVVLPLLELNQIFHLTEGSRCGEWAPTGISLSFGQYSHNNLRLWNRRFIEVFSSAFTSVLLDIFGSGASYDFA
jgi:hypothetical protein